METDDFFALTARLREMLKADLAIGKQQESPLRKLLLALGRWSAIRKPVWLRLGRLLLPYASEYEISLYEDEDDPDSHIARRGLSTDVGRYVGEARDGDAIDFIAALLNCVWDNPNHIDVFADTPIPRSNLPLSVWIETALTQITSISTKDLSQVPSSNGMAGNSESLHSVLRPDENTSKQFSEEYKFTMKENYAENHSDDYKLLSARLSKISNEPYAIDTLLDFVDPEYAALVEIELTSSSHHVSLNHNVDWIVKINRFEYFVEEGCLSVLAKNGTRKSIATKLADHVVERIMSVDVIWDTLWEKGPQPGVLKQEPYPLKIIS